MPRQLGRGQVNRFPETAANYSHTNQRVAEGEIEPPQSRAISSVGAGGERYTEQTLFADHSPNLAEYLTGKHPGSLSPEQWLGRKDVFYHSMTNSKIGTEGERLQREAGYESFEYEDGDSTTSNVPLHQWDPHYSYEAEVLGDDDDEDGWGTTELVDVPYTHMGTARSAMHVAGMHRADRQEVGRMSALGSLTVAKRVPGVEEAMSMPDRGTNWHEDLGYADDYVYRYKNAVEDAGSTSVVVRPGEVRSWADDVVDWNDKGGDHPLTGLAGKLHQEEEGDVYGGGDLWAPTATLSEHQFTPASRQPPQLAGWSEPNHHRERIAQQKLARKQGRKYSY